jgi:hypothetical protein
MCIEICVFLSILLFSNRIQRCRAQYHGLPVPAGLRAGTLWDLYRRAGHLLEPA